MNGEKSLHTVWAEPGNEFPEIFNLCAAQTLENADGVEEMKRPMIVTEKERCKSGTPRETIMEERIWNTRPDGLAITMPTLEKADLSSWNSRGCPM